MPAKPNAAPTAKPQPDTATRARTTAEGPRLHAQPTLGPPPRRVRKPPRRRSNQAQQIPPGPPQRRAPHRSPTSTPDDTRPTTPPRRRPPPRRSCNQTRQPREDHSRETPAQVTASTPADNRPTTPPKPEAAPAAEKRPDTATPPGPHRERPRTGALPPYATTSGPPPGQAGGRVHSTGRNQAQQSPQRPHREAPAPGGGGGPFRMSSLLPCRSVHSATGEGGQGPFTGPGRDWAVEPPGDGRRDCRTPPQPTAAGAGGSGARGRGCTSGAARP
jgi:hypothetical protein